MQEPDSDYQTALRIAADLAIATLDNDETKDDEGEFREGQRTIDKPTRDAARAMLRSEFDFWSGAAREAPEDEDPEPERGEED